MRSQNTLKISRYFSDGMISVGSYTFSSSNASSYTTADVDSNTGNFFLCDKDGFHCHLTVTFCCSLLIFDVVSFLLPYIISPKVPTLKPSSAPSFQPTPVPTPVSQFKWIVLVK